MNPALSLYSISFKLIKILFSNWICVLPKKNVEYSEGAG
jgi:hypothetical protein